MPKLKLGGIFRLPGKKLLNFAERPGDTAPPGAPSRFTDLLDCPSDYNGHANKVPVVNSTEDGLNFKIPESFSFTWKLTTAVDDAMNTIGTTVAQYMIPKAGRVHTLTVVGYNIAAGTFTATLEKGGNPTTLSCEVWGTGGSSEFGSAVDAAGISVAATNLLSIEIDITAGAGTWDITAVVSGVYD